MKVGMAFLVAAYVLSQFYRAFLAVLSPVLAVEIGAGPQVLSLASGLWFLAFAVMQIPVGYALDTIGPRRTASVLLALGGGGGALVFALAGGPWAIYASMILIGIGCSPVLMASYYIFARVWPPAMFGMLAGATIGAGSLGNLAGSLPMAWAVDAFGWRETLGGLAGLSLLVAGGLALTIIDPPSAHDSKTSRGKLTDLLRIPALWLVLPLMFVNYIPAAGIRGLWVGPYFGEVFGYDAQGIGRVTLAMAVAMIIGNFAYGPLDRVFGTRKWVVLVGNLFCVACLLGLWLAPGGSALHAGLLIAGVGLFGASFPMIMAHGRSFFPPQLVGRGVTLLNLFGIGGVGIAQFASGPLYAGYLTRTGAPAEAFGLLFLTFALVLLSGCVIYLFSKDRLS